MDTQTSVAKVYTDFQGLGKLRAEVSQNKQAALHEVAQQFEAILLQFSMKTMREANKAFTSDDFKSDTMDFFQDMQDQQMALSLSGNFGVSQMLERQLSKSIQPVTANSTAPLGTGLASKTMNSMSDSQNFSLPLLSNGSAQSGLSSLATKTLDTLSSAIQTPVQFVQSLWSSAKAAASSLGVDPKVLLAQAALETDWGRRVIKQSDGTSSYNLFGIKADPSWQQNKVVVGSLEYENGAMVQQKSAFRSYGSFAESFADYANFLRTNPRYQEALQNSSNATAFTAALQKAGYATDPHYAEKINAIMNSDVFSAVTK